MKFQITFKTPDAVENAIEEIVPKVELGDFDDEEASEADYCRQKTVDDLKEFVARWVRYGECVTIEFDTDNCTAVVVHNN